MSTSSRPVIAKAFNGFCIFLLLALMFSSVVSASCFPKVESEAQDQQEMPQCCRFSDSAAENLNTAMIRLEGGLFIMGTNDTEQEAIFDEIDGESPARLTYVSSFRISKYSVTSKDFERFVEATGYVTEAEEYEWSFCFENLLSTKTSEKSTEAAYLAPWWVKVFGADWKHPHGPDSQVNDIMDHPVTQMSHNDAKAFCKWFVPDGRLPTEAEWEFAARGGVDGNIYPWGNEMFPNNRRRMNVWESAIPAEDLPSKNFYQNGEYYLYPDPNFYHGYAAHLLPPSTADLFIAPPEDDLAAVATCDSTGLTAPVRVELTGWDKVMASVHVTLAFYRSGVSEEKGSPGTVAVDSYGPQNDLGMYNMVGNVWEWVSDWFTTEHNVTFPVTGDPRGPADGEKKVLKGGSFLCNWLTCPRMRPSGRKGLPPDSASDVLGFRCAAPG